MSKDDKTAGGLPKSNMELLTGKSQKTKPKGGD